MPVRGENIGTAYVRIVASGDKAAFKEEIEDLFGDDDFEVQARKTSNRWKEAFVDEISKAPNQTALRDAIAGPLERGNWLEGTFFRSTNWRNFRAGMVNQFGAMGERAADNLEASLHKNLDFDRFNARLDNLMPELELADSQLLKEQGARLSNFFRNQQQNLTTIQANEVKRRMDLDKDFEMAHIAGVENAMRVDAEWNEMLREAYWINRDMNLKALTLQRRQRDELRRLAHDYRRLTTELRFMEAGSKRVTLTHKELINQFRDLRESASKASLSLDDIGDDAGNIDRRMAQLTPRMSRFNAVLDDTADRIGTAFGRGSRNNFINFTGSVIRNTLRMANLVPKAFEQILKVGRGFATAFTGAGGGLSGMVAGFASLGPLLAASAGGLAAVAIGVGVLSAVLGPLVALVSGLVGILAAMAGTIGFAIAGAVGVLAGALAPLVAGFAGLAIGIANVSDRTKALKEVVRPLKDELSDLSNAAGDELMSGIRDSAPQIERVLRSLVPITRNVTAAMSNVFEGWADGLDSPEFRDWLDIMDRWLPRAIEKIGTIFSNTFEGIGGMFVGLRPAVNDFLGWLEGITQEFSEWANSARGRREIREFMEKASDSAKALGGFLQQAGGFLADLMDAGRGDGDSLFESMADNIKRFRDYLKENPDALRNWFRDARQLGEKLGDAAIEVGKIIDKLDSPEARETIQNIVDGFRRLGALASAAGGLIDSGLLFPLQNVLEAIQDVKNRMGGLNDKEVKIKFTIPKVRVSLLDVFTGIPGAIATLVKNFKPVGGMILRGIGKVNIGGIITGAARALGSMLGTFAGAGAKVVSKIGKADVGKIIIGVGTALISLLNPFNGGGKKVVSRIGKADVGNMIIGAATALTKMVAVFNPAAGMILRAIGSVNVAGIISGASTAASNLVSAFYGVGGRILDAIGTITPRISMPNIPGFAAGGIGGVTGGPMLRWVGEDGPEAIVPLNRPLSEVDPAVRWLSAIAQGKASMGGASKIVDVGGIQVVTSTRDPYSVAVEVVNRLTAVSF